jgi:signal transduction histidine kinase
MNLRDRRAALAFGLTLLALAVPCIAWYLVGSREVEHQAADLANGAQQTARDTAARLAQQLTQRLSNLREAEARRPFYHYQPYFHDPQGASEGASVVPSPLSTGAKDPLVQIYFQVDGASGRLTLPTATAELQQVEQAQSRYARADEQLFLQRQLERGLASILFAVRGESLPQQKSAAVGQRVEVLEKRAWAQNVDAQELYSNIKSRSAQTQQTPALAVTNDTGQVQIFVGALKWRTVYVAGNPSLVALREVTTPQGAVLQGFLISAAGLADYFKTAGLPAKLLPGAPAGDLEAAVAVAEEPWRIIVDAGAARAAAAQQVRELRRGFLTIFLGGVGIAALAGLCVVWLVWQTERLARQRSQFAASAAHELRTPLAGLRIYSDMLAEGLGDPGKSKDYARRVADEAERLGRVVANVLGFTRLERGTLRVQPATGDLTGAVREAIARQQPALEAAGARLEVSIADNLPAVKFDRDAVAQILQNLLDNAEKHTRTAANRTILVALAPQNGRVALTVADHGPGVPADVRQHLFQAFTRGNQTDAPAGLGLGLVLVKALAEAQGATVTCTDADGGGAKFVVTFPA